MTSYSFEIPGVPVPKARPRASTRGGHVVMYTPTASKNFEYQIKQIASKEITTPLMAAVDISIIFYLPRPKNMIWKTKPMPALYHTKKPDLDNLIKSTIDGLNTIAFRDDSQVASIQASKLICSGSDIPKTIINITSISL